MTQSSLPRFWQHVESYILMEVRFTQLHFNCHVKWKVYKGKKCLFNVSSQEMLTE